MNGKKPDDKLDAQHPLIRQIAEMSAEATGSRLLLIYPEEDGWRQTHADTQTRLIPAFCKLIRGSLEGGKHCRMCHILMAVAACNGGPLEQQCHAGSSVLVSPASGATGESVAVLSSCMFRSHESSREIRHKAVKLGLDPDELHKAYLALPQLNKRQLTLLQNAMQSMSYALQLVRQNMDLAAQVRELQTGSTSKVELEKFLEETTWAGPRPAQSKAAGGRPLLIHVVCELMRQRPDLPLTVKELAAAARLTPNHFTTLFREHAGIPFTEYLTDQRIARAKKLLQNLTLNIKEIARLVGYDDPGYFTRRFHKKTKLSPGEWRNRTAGRKAQDPDSASD